MAVGCPFITCAIKKKRIEFCWECDDGKTCPEWRKHREASRTHDSFVCYQRLEANINLIELSGIKEFEKDQRTRERLLRSFLKEFNEGRSKTYYSIAATVMEIDELRTALLQARRLSSGMGMKDKSRVLHSLLDDLAVSNRYHLKLRR
jgi:hypothetical protein